MAEFQFDLVSPERKLAELPATSVQIPGANGDFTAMPNHAPFLTTLRPGIVRVLSGSTTTEYVVTGGFAEISPTSATILAEQAVPRSEVKAAMFTDLLAEAQSAATEATEENKIATAQRVRDITTLKSALGL